MQTFFQTLRTWRAEGGTTFVCAETAMRVLLAGMLRRRASCGGGRAEPLIRKNNRAPTRRAARERNADSV